MTDLTYQEASFDSKSPLSIYEYSRYIIGQSLHSLLGEVAINHKRKGKGGLGQMVALKKS